MESLACAKLNLTLDVLGKRSDGYHDMKMVMQSVNLCDRLTITFAGNGLQVRSNLKFLPSDGKNLAAQAALRFWEASNLPEESILIELDKKIPVCAGMAGGSSDAAAVLRMLNNYYGGPLSEAELLEVGARVGSDVPYCLMGGTALAEGRGECLTPLPLLPPCHIVLCKPSLSISTPELFGRIQCGKIRRRPDTAGVLTALDDGDLPGVARRLYNVFEDVLPDRTAAVIREIKQILIHSGALGTAMSGTGSTVFGIFDTLERAEDAVRTLKWQYSETFLVKPV